MKMKIGPSNSVNVQAGRALEKAKIPGVKVDFTERAQFASKGQKLNPKRVSVPEVTKRGRSLTKQVTGILKQIPTPFLTGLTGKRS